MTISARDTIAAEVEGGNKSVGTRAYFQARLKNRLHDLVLRKFQEAERSQSLTRAELARRIGKRPEVLTRLLGAPGNWTLDTVSDLLLGIAEYELDATATSVAGKAVRNSGYEHLSKGLLQQILNKDPISSESDSLKSYAASRSRFNHENHENNHKPSRALRSCYSSASVQT